MEILLTLPGFILAIFIVVMYEIKLRKPQNKVRFFVAKDKAYTKLFIGRPVLCDYKNVFYGYFHNGKYVSVRIALEAQLKDFGLNLDDFADMKDGEIREVFLNLED